MAFLKQFPTFIKYGLFILLISICNNINAQEADLGNWLVLIGNKKIEQRWNWEHSLQHRDYSLLSDLRQLLVRNGIGYNLTPGNNNLSLGYDYLLDRRYDEFDEKSITNREHRIYQQFLTKQNAGKVVWKHRYRFEEQFINDFFQFRFRYALFLNVPINKYKMSEANTLYVSAYNEFFLKNAETVFDQNWSYLALGFKLTKDIKVELGYMVQTYTKGTRDQLNLLANINW